MNGLPLSRGQRALWFLERLAPGNPAYLIAGAGRLRGELDPDALRRALGSLAARHPALRTTFHGGPEGPYQQVHQSLEPEVPELGPCAGDEAELARLLAGVAFRPFDLEAGPLWRAALVPLPGGDHAFVLAVHHIVADFWSLGILVRELGALYGGEVLAPPGIAPGDWVRRQEELLAGPEGERLWEFWRRELSGAPLALELPTDRPRPPAQGWRGGTVSVELPAELAGALRRQGRRRGATPYMVLLAAFQAVLARWTGQEKLLVGTPTTGRRAPEVAGLVGYLVNPVVVVGDLSGEPTFAELLGRVREHALAAFEHQDYPFPLLAERLQPDRDPSRPPVFQAMFVLQKGRRKGEEGIAALWAGESGAVVPMGPLELESIGLPEPGAQVDLWVGLAESRGRLVGRWQYDRDLFDAATVERMAGHLRTLLEGALSAPPGSLAARVGELPLLGEAERHQLLAEWNDTAAPAPGLDVLTAFRGWARRTPEALAVAGGAERLTYGELHRRAGRLARELRRLGVGPETVVGLCLERSVELLVGVVGVLAAGGAYLPLDPAQPAERIAYALEDSGALLALDRATIRSLATGAGAPSPLAPLPAQLAYVIYTSGSTGKPKGTELTHAGLANLVSWHRRDYEVSPRDRASLVAGVGFDASVWEVWSYLTAGASLWLPPAEVVAQPEALLAWLAEHEITLAFLPTPLLEAALAAPLPGSLSLRAVLTGGDRLHRGAPEGAGFALVNHYGPTESTVVTTAGRVAPGPGAPPIGRPIANLRVHLLDRRLRPVPLGAAGELCTGGAGLARGYRGRPELTAERFVPDPLAAVPGERLYRTGDLARRRADGELEFLGRIDQQVKVRGFRIELGEVESALASCPGVWEAVVVPVGEGARRRLVGFVAPAGQAPAAAGELRERLKTVLPSYMVPSALVALDELPLTPNGKVDRRELERRALAVRDEAGGAAPRTPAEELLAGIWADLLGVERVGPGDDFFLLGGHSLLAAQLVSRVRERLGVELPLVRVFEAPTLAALAREVAAAWSAGRAPAPPVLPVGRDRELPLSFAQEGLWFLDRLEPGGAAYNVAGGVRLRGPLRVPALAAALSGIVARHEPLRTSFAEVAGRPVQAIAPPAPRTLPVVDLAALPAGRGAAELDRLAGEEARRLFDLQTGPLLRTSLVRLGEAAHALLVTMHHIVSDGWSLGVFVRELAALYGGATDLPDLPVQYADYAVWQRERLEGGILERQLAWWRERLAGAPQVLELPADRPRPAVASLRGAHLPVALGALVPCLAGLCRREGVTPFMVLLAAFAALLSRHTGQEDLLVGSPVAGRGRLETEGLIGFFVNTLALRVDLAGDPSFRELLGRARDMALGAYDHQDLPFERLVEDLAPRRDRSRSPLIQAMLAFQRSPLESLALPGLEIEPFEPGTGAARLDLTLSLQERGETLAGWLEYSRDLFDTPTLLRMAGHLEALLAAATAAPDRRLSALPLTSEAERHQMIREWGRTRTADLAPGTIAAAFAAWAKATPAAPALTGGGETLSYRELDRRADRLAHRLLAHGLGPEEPVALCLERSAGWIVAALAALKAGGWYLPLDPALPDERLALLLAGARRGSQARSRPASVRPLLLARGHELERFSRLAGPAARVLDIDGEEGFESAASPAAAAGPDSLAYVMYTSGSTGAPKGVAVPHRAVLRLARESWWASFGPGEVFLQLAPPSFDAATLEIWGALLHGGHLVVAPPGPPSLAGLGGEIARSGVTTLWLTAGLFHQMVETDLQALAPLRQLLAGGDVLSPPHVARVLAELPGLRLVNGYGPTENTTFTCCWPVRETRPRTPVPVGRPIANTEVLILDRNARPAPIGVAGELCAGGDGLARCYLGLPDLTAERFVPHPEGASGERLYRTGDLARWRPDGTVEFLGRLDQQVKIRGFRVEPGEVEAVLQSHPGVIAAAVVAREDGPDGRWLVAYVVAAGELPAEELRSFARAKLPEPMVPSAFVLLDRLPFTPNGKLDRKALPAPERSAGAAFVPPRTPAEARVAEIWAELLGVDRVGAEDDFFRLGGHSLLAARLAWRLREAFGVELSLARLFEAPTVEALARAVERPAGAGAPPLLPVPRDRELPLSFAQERLWFLDQLDPGSPAYNVVGGVRLRGRLAVAALAAALAGIVRRHEALRTTFTMAAGRPVQVIAPAGSRELPVVDLGSLPAELREAELAAVAGREARRPFDLAAGPLLRVLLVRLADADHGLILALHHIVSDGWSVGVLIRELALLYAGTEPPRLPVQYADYAVWQRQWLVGEALEEQLSWWRTSLAGAPQVLELPADRPRPAVRSGRGAILPFEVPRELAQGVAELARRERATPFMALLAAFGALLSRLSGQDDLLVGSPVASRTRLETEGLIGFFVNTLVLRADLAGGPGFGELMGRLRRVVLGATAHQDLPFERLVEELAPERDRGRTPLFQVMLSYQRDPLERLELAGLALEPFEPDSGAAKFDLTFSLVESAAGLCGALEYSLDPFDRSTAERLAGHFVNLLAAAVADPRQRVRDLPLLSAAEERQLLEWSRGPALPPGELSLRRLLAAPAARTPAAPAVSDGSRCLSYGELHAAASALARRLHRLGVLPGARVGIALERSVDLVVALLAAVEAGATYVPVDPTYPRERIAHILTDARAALLLTRRELAAGLPESGARLALVDEEEPEAAGPAPAAAPPVDGGLLYVIYTSGSTGRPKGAAVYERSFLGLLRWYVGELGLDGTDRVLAVSSFSFDLTQKNLFAPLLVGARLHLAPRGYDPAELVRTIGREGITRLNCTPSAFYPLLDGADLSPLDSLRTVVLGGEPVARARLERCRAEVINSYGPTECTDVVAFHRLASGGEEPVPTGRPVPGARLWVLDRELRPVPAGVAGQLCVGGQAVGAGYLGDPVLTAREFVPDPLADEPGARLYQTGDLARWLGGGELQYLGRMDEQVKVRGFRVELGEIEAALSALPGVRQAAAAVREDRLVGYAAGEGLSAAALREGLAARLPAFMVPGAFVILESLPLTPSGKVDRRALPAPESGGEEGFEPPRTPAEELLAGIWSEVLGVGRVGAGDDFFGLGGHSLLATRVVGRVREVFGVELPLRRVFERPTVAALALEVEAARRDGAVPAAPPVLPVPRDRSLPLSFSQERLWFLDRLDPGSPTYNVPAASELTGDLDVAALAASLEEVVRRHEVLRTAFAVDRDRPVPVAAPVRRHTLPLVDLTALPAAGREAAARELSAAEGRRPFDLAAGPLLRSTLLRLGAGGGEVPARHLLLLTMHHIVSDAWSIEVLIRELSALYPALSAGAPPPLPELPVQYADYAAWQREWLRGPVLEALLAWWRERLAGAPAALDLPADRPRPAAQSFRGGRVEVFLPPRLAGSLEALGRRAGATLFTALAAGFQALLSRYSGSLDVPVGTPIAGRARTEVAGLIGFFVNTLVLRLDLSGRPGMRQLAERSREVALGAYDHQDLPFEKLVEALRPERHLAHAPLFQVMFAFQNAPREALRLPGVELEQVTVESGRAKFDLSLGLRATEGGLAGGIEYSRDLFDAPTVLRLAGHLRALLEAAAADPERPVEELPFLSATERHQIAHEWRRCAGGPTAQPMVYERFRRQAARRPEAVALACGDDHITYGGLAARTEAIAGHLRSLGVGPEVLVGICLERSWGQVAAMLGVAAAGGAFLPIDPTTPAERTQGILAEARPAVLLTEERLLGRLPLPEAEVVCLDWSLPPAEDGRALPPPARPALPASMAYVLYTSGSTGRPKGVAVPHLGIGNLVEVYLADAIEEDRSLCKFNLVFDAALAQTLPFLVAGGRVIVLPAGPDPGGAELLRILAEQGVTVTGVTPSLAGTLTELPELAASLRSLRRLALGTEAVPPDLPRRLRALLPDTPVDNRYGPTEATVFALTWRCRPGEAVVPIGRPVPGVEGCLLDVAGQEVPVGVPGELCLGGACLARGYLGRPELTAEKFVPHPSPPAPGERLYRTGDLVRFRADGAVEFLGRIDQQVKVRGFRVEPGEIEAVLAACPGVRGAVVVDREDAATGSRILVAYAEPEEGAQPEAAQMRDFLRQRLPGYMVPSAYVVLPALPLLPSGKVDRQALKQMRPPAERREPAFEPPGTAVEEALAEIWAEVLGRAVAEIGIHDDFFELGGHSLSVTQVLLRIREAFGVELPVRTFFHSPTLAGLALALAEGLLEADGENLSVLLEELS